MKSNRFLSTVGLTTADLGRLFLKQKYFCLFLKCPSLA